MMWTLLQNIVPVIIIWELLISSMILSEKNILVTMLHLFMVNCKSQYQKNSMSNINNIPKAYANMFSFLSIDMLADIKTGRCGYHDAWYYKGTTWRQTRHDKLCCKWQKFLQAVRY